MNGSVRVCVCVLCVDVSERNKTNTFTHSFSFSFSFSITTSSVALHVLVCRLLLRTFYMRVMRCYFLRTCSLFCGDGGNVGGGGGGGDGSSSCVPFLCILSTSRFQCILVRRLMMSSAFVLFN